MEKIKAEVWDRMQFVFRHYYDRTMHCVQIYDKGIDDKVLGEVLMGMLKKAPILHSSFHNHPIKPYWKVEEYSLNDFYIVKLDCKDLDSEIDKFVCQSIDHNWNVQFRFGLLSDGDRYAMIMIGNHMCMDGGDFKYFMAMIAKNYAKALNGDFDFELKQGSRSLEEIYTGLSEEDAKIAKKLYKNISKVNDNHKFPLTPPSKDDKNIMVKRTIDVDTFAKFKAKSKEMGLTLNDAMTAIYMRSIYDIGNFNETDTIAIPCMVDLRRHAKDNGAYTGLANHTGFMVCRVHKKGKDLKETLSIVTEALKPNKEDKFLGLYGLPTINFGYHVFPQCLMEKLVLIFFDNPLMGMSNVGLMDQKTLKMGDSNLIGGFMTGAVKSKPYMQLAFTTCAGSMLMTIAVKGNDKDREIINKFFDYFMGYVNELIAE